MIRDLIDIGEVVRRAHVFDFGKLRERPVDEGDLLYVVDMLFTLLDEREIDYVLVGGIALLQYIDGRNTEDIDLIVALADLHKVPEIQLLEQSDYFAQGSLGQLRIDFLLTRNRLFQHVRRHFATMQEFAGRHIRSATVDGLLLLKLYALPSLYRQADFTRVGLYENDVATLMQRYRPNMAALLESLQAYLTPADLAAVQEIVGEIQRRIERFEQAIVE